MLLGALNLFHILPFFKISLRVHYLSVTHRFTLDSSWPLRSLHSRFSLFTKITFGSGYSNSTSMSFFAHLTSVSLLPFRAKRSRSAFCTWGTFFTRTPDVTLYDKTRISNFFILRDLKHLIVSKAKNRIDLAFAFCSKIFMF